MLTFISSSQSEHTSSDHFHCPSHLQLMSQLNSQQTVAWSLGTRLHDDPVVLHAHHLPCNVMYNYVHACIMHVDDAQHHSVIHWHTYIHTLYTILLDTDWRIAHDLNLNWCINSLLNENIFAIMQGQHNKCHNWSNSTKTMKICTGGEGNTHMQWALFHVTKDNMSQ